MRKCPHCNGNLVAHSGINEGFFHCNQCGCCFDGETKDLRKGSMACAPANAMAASLDQTALTNRIAELEAQLNTHPAVARVEELEKMLVEREAAEAAAKVPAVVTDEPKTAASTPVTTRLDAGAKA